MKVFLLLSVLALHSSLCGQTPAEPEIILPSQEKKSSDSPTLTSVPTPLAYKALGQMASDLVAYFSMDNATKGGLAWSRQPLRVTATDEVVIKEADGRQYADFSRKGACLILTPPVPLGKRFSIAAWVQTPAPQNHATIWSGSGALLIVKAASLSYWSAASRGGDYAKTAKPLNGWIHVTVNCDGSKTQAFLNGNALDSVKGSVSSSLANVGNSPDPQHQHLSLIHI